MDALSRAKRLGLVVGLIGSLAVGCSGSDDGDDDVQPAGWQVVYEELPGALLSVWGTSAEDVWAVGADARDGTGPLVLHYEGTAWERIETGQSAGNLWWVFGFESGPIYMGGDGGVILRYDGTSFTVMETPAVGTVFGIWGSSPSDLWAVGGDSGAQGGFAWRNDGGPAWEAEQTLPTTVTASAAVWKVFGTGADDAWLVGSGGVSFRWDGQALTEGETGVEGGDLFTVHASGGVYAAVGGQAAGYILENDGSGWRNVTPSATPTGLSGVALGPDGTGYAVGLLGAVYARSETGWEEDLEVPVSRSLHGVWVDPTGGVWAVGGRTESVPLTEGVLIHKGDPVPTGGT